MAMQFLGKLFDEILNARGIKLNILGATSGDTGSAAEYAMMGRRSVSVFMLSPKDRMSEFQKSQMYSIKEQNIHNIVVPGSFDNCQDLVKAVSNDLRVQRFIFYWFGKFYKLGKNHCTGRLLFFWLFQSDTKIKKKFNASCFFCCSFRKFWQYFVWICRKKNGLTYEKFSISN